MEGTPRKRLRPMSDDPAQRKRQLEAWICGNRFQLDKVERLLTQRWQEPNLFGEQRQLCDKVLQVMRRVLGGESAESKSLLLLGEAGSGKTQAVDWCLQKLKEENKNIITLRARGDLYGSNVECLRHLAQQIAGQLMTVPQSTGSFEGSMEWFRCILKESFHRDSAVVIVLDRFEHFCGMARQTLLYNLFNLAQDLSVRLCIVGVSEKFDVTCQLEKRILSRFSMEYLFAFLPRDAKELTRVLECKLTLPEDAAGFTTSFIYDFNQRVSEAIAARLPQWMQDIELGRKPTWFLWQCLPVVGFLRRALGDAPDATKQRIATLGEDAQRRRLFLRGLAECEHLVLLSLFRQRAAKVRSLSTVLFELLRLVECNGKVLAGHTEESLSAAFFRLISYKLVTIPPVSNSDVSTRYRPCESEVDEEYRQWVEDMAKKQSAMLHNPLKDLPEAVQSWLRTE